MRVVAITKQQTDYSRDVDTFLTDFKRLTGHDIEVLDPDSIEATTFIEAYDIVEYPTLIAISDDGRVQNTWKGMPLPTLSEVSYYYV